MIWIFVSLALILSFLLSGLETAVLGVSRVRLRHRAKENDPSALRLERLFDRRNRVLASVLFANNSVNLLLFAFLTQSLVAALGPRGYFAAIVISLPIYVLFLELVPKALFKRFPYRCLNAFLPLLSVTYYSLLPLMKLGTLLPKRWRQGTPPPDKDQREEFKALTEVIEREGSLTKDEKDLIQNVIDFDDITAEQAMIPLSKVTAIPLEMPISAVIDLTRETRLDQFPVISPEGQLVGLVNTFEILRDENPRGSVVRYLRRLVRTRPEEKATSIIQRLRRGGIQLAAVCNPSGRPLGIVSAEDLVRQMLHRP
ncbi:MAG: CNNM domain-containing protein [Verrucomicrobiota bacterium]